MCHRVSPLLLNELKDALENQRATGHARVPRRTAQTPVPDAYPGTQLPLFVPTSTGELEALALTWGFENPGNRTPKLVFNTRIETALAHASSGRGMWSRAIVHGRCLVPVRSFYESWTRTPPHRGMEVRFASPDHTVFLLAGIYENDRCSIVTTEPNADVAPHHSRMPLVLAPGESSVWLGPDFARLSDRSAIRLTATA